VDEVIAEAHLSAEHLYEGIEKFVRDRDKRLAALRGAVAAVQRA
jgi:transketolase